MFISHVIDYLTVRFFESRPIAYLDACAAPGGKTTAAIDALPHGSVVVANEYVASRADILRENLARWGSPMTLVTQGDVGRFRRMGASFDIIAADVPCSGEGMMRKDVKAVEQWSAALVVQCAERQRSIVADLWDALCPGGFLIYSTCTYSREENEEVIALLVEKYGAVPVAIPCDSRWNIVPGVDTPYPCYRFVPGTTRGEGLFMAVVRKPLAQPCVNKRRVKAEPLPKVDPKIASQCRTWLDIDTDITIDERGRVIALPHTAPGLGMHPQLRPAIHIADLKGRDVLPTAALVLSTAFRRDAFPAVDLVYSEALQYLRGEVVILPEGTPRGPVVVTYGGEPLGVVKNIGSRANNQHPAPWRILTATTPAAPPALFS